VYSRPKDQEAYRRDGKFPDSAVLVKDITNVASEKLTTGQATRDTDVKIWFVMVKDARGRFPKNDLWGDGWGWPRGTIGVHPRILGPGEAHPAQMNDGDGKRTRKK
jgi:hypothetical protein